jgi:hypothetical protein
VILEKGDAMKKSKDILNEVAGLSPRERAAAIAHYVYMKTSEQVGWGKRVPTDWVGLEPDAQAFNLASVDTWARESELFKEWNTALDQLRGETSADAE